MKLKMEIKIKYFGILTEFTNCQEETLTIASDSILELINLVTKKHPELTSKDFQVAQNKMIVSVNTKIDGTEIAFLPPFSGG